MAAHGHGLAGSGESTVARPQCPTPQASATQDELRAMERRDGKRPERHDHV
jgi:hypothetical protein